MKPFSTLEPGSMTPFGRVVSRSRQTGSQVEIDEGNGSCGWWTEGRFERTLRGDKSVRTPNEFPTFEVII